MFVPLYSTTDKSAAAAMPAYIPRAVFGVSLEESLDVAQIASLPAIVFRCIQYLEAKKAEQEASNSWTICKDKMIALKCEILSTLFLCGLASSGSLLLYHEINFMSASLSVRLHRL